MHTIPLEEAFRVLSDSCAVMLQGVVVQPVIARAKTNPLQINPSHEFMALDWIYDGTGVRFSVRFTEGANQAVEAGAHDLWLIDTEGQKARITILVPAHLGEPLKLAQTGS